jgi:hypothetical protein
MRFLTWCGRGESLRVAPLLRSAARFGITVEIVCCSGLIDKLASLNRSLRSIDDDEWVLCSDGYDCIYLNDEQEIVKRLSSFPSRIVFSGQSTEDHHLDYVVGVCKERKPTGFYPILNSGIIAGRCGNLKSMLSEILQWRLGDIEREFSLRRAGVGCVNDQTLFGRFFALNPTEVDVDSKAVVSWTSAYENEEVDNLLESRPVQIKSPYTDECPCLFHLPCTSPGVYLQFLQMYSALGYDLGGEVVDIVRVESFRGQSGKVGVLADYILQELRRSGGFRSYRRQHYLRHYKRRCRILLSRLFRRFVPKNLKAE